MNLEIIVGLAIVGLFTVLPIATVSHLFSRIKKETRVRQQLANWARILVRTIDGSAWTFFPGKLFGQRAKLEGRIGKRLLVITANPAEENWNIYVRIPLSGPPRAEMRLEPDTPRQLIKNYFIQKPRIGDDEFDGQFHIVSTAKVETLQDLVSAPVREGLLYVRQRRGGRVVLQLTNEEILFEERGAPDELDGYDELLISLCSLAATAEKGEVQKTSGLFLMELVAGDEESEATCPVCGTCIGVSVTECVACGALHHPDCWEYNEGCAIYACNCKDGKATAAKNV